MLDDNRCRGGLTSAEAGERFLGSSLRSCFVGLARSLVRAFGSNSDFLMDEHEARILADVDMRFSVNG